MPAIFDLVMQLAIYEQAPDQVITSADRYLQDFSEGKFDALVAEEDATGRVVGMALYYFAYSTWKGQYLWLEDFVVEEAARGKGIGKSLFDAVIALAKETNTFLKWQVLDWNTPAMQFYDQYAAVYEKDWVTCRKWVR